jgi:hypothetical protein
MIHLWDFIFFSHLSNFRAWTLNNTGESAWDKGTSPAAGAARNSKPTYKDHFTFTHDKKTETVKGEMDTGGF